MRFKIAVTFLISYIFEKFFNILLLHIFMRVRSQLNLNLKNFLLKYFFQLVWILYD
jgi:hypothetical protein